MNHENWNDELKHDHFPHDGQKKHESIANDVKDYVHVCSNCRAELTESERKQAVCNACRRLFRGMIE